MHLRHLLIGLAATFTFSSLSWAATVYKWTDSNGVVHYSDQPEPGAQRIETQTVSDAPRTKGSAAPVTTARAVRKPQDPDQARTTALDYTDFGFDMPQPEQNYNDGTVPVRVRLEPHLRNAHMLTLYLDGKLVTGQRDNTTEFTLTDVPRGAHTLIANVTDADSNESKNSPGLTFYVQRPSLLAPLRRKK
jgi:hypothetical protein